MAHAHQPFAHAPGPRPPHGSADEEYYETPPGAGYEHTDASVWIIVKFGLWLAVSAVIIHIALGFLFGIFVKRSEEASAEFPLASRQEHRLPAGPRLQQFPVNEFYEFHQKEEAVLNNYGWVSKDAGVVRMPIAEAMRLTVERGLPVRVQQTAPASPSEPAAQAPSPTQSLGLMPADSSAGRTMERRRQ